MLHCSLPRVMPSNEAKKNTQVAVLLSGKGFISFHSRTIVLVLELTELSCIAAAGLVAGDDSIENIIT